MSNQSQGFYGSFCLEDLFTGKLAKGSNGKTYVCIDDLTEAPFNQSPKNTKHYVNIGVWVNDGIDEYGNVGSISLSQSKEDRERQVKKTYIGNLKRSGGVGATAASPVAPVQNASPAIVNNNLPF